MQFHYIFKQYISDVGWRHLQQHHHHLTKNTNNYIRSQFNRIEITKTRILLLCVLFRPVQIMQRNNNSHAIYISMSKNDAALCYTVCVCKYVWFK